MTTIQTVSQEITTQLSNSGNINAAFETEYILSEILNCSRLDLHLNLDKELTEDTISDIRSVAKRRTQNEPLQYILGKAYFMDLCLQVGPGVLIPRPETELLVELVCNEAPQKAHICDIGTGSGTISLSIAHERPDTNVTGLDLKPEALKYAYTNKENYNLENVELLESDLLSSVADRTFDVITANLPYVSQTEYDKLEEEVKEHEPKSALYADNEGLALIATTIDQAVNCLKPNGLIIFEHGYEQGPAVKKMLEQNGNYCKIEIIKDLNNHDRFVRANLK